MCEIALLVRQEKQGAYKRQWCRADEQKKTFTPLPDTPPCRLQILGQTGNWFNYIATLTVVSRLADGRGLPISIVLIIHFLPSFIWFPVAGVVADR